MTPAPAAKTKLPAGPPIPTPLQAAIWALRPLELMDRCEARYGEIFTLRIRRRRPWVLLTNPEHVKLVFTRPSRCSSRCLGRAP
jgi:cytochrome P450